MSFKLVIVFVMVALTSARTAMQNNMLMSQQMQMQNEQMQQQQQDQIQQQQNQIKQQQIDEIQQRFQQRQELENQRQMQEQLILDQQQESLDSMRSAQNTLMITQNPTSDNVQLVTIPSSRRVVQVLDPASYNFGYAVSDYTTGDIKSQQEIRRGDNVQGQYTMIDTDGYRRFVDYTADDVNGFSAGVRREQIRPQYYYIESPIQSSQYLRHQSLSIVPTSYSTAHVSKNDNGVHNEYTTSSSSSY